MTLRDIIKQTFINLDQKEILPTPSEYAKEFYEIAAKENFPLRDYDNLKNIATIIQKAIEPNSTNASSDTLLLFILELKNNPEKIFDKETQDKISKYLKTKQQQDARNFELKTHNVSTLTKHLGRFLDSSLASTTTNTKDVNSFINTLQKKQVNSADQINELKHELLDIANDFSTILVESHSKMSKGQKSVIHIEEQLDKIKNELQEIHANTILDHETNLPTLTSFKKELKFFDLNYMHYHQKYAIVLVELDHFNTIISKYSKEGGIFILTNFAKVLSTVTRKHDYVARYGTCSFISLISYDSPKEIIQYMTRVKDIVSNYTFKYNNYHINVTFGAGITLRENYLNSEDTFNEAVNCQKKAKHAGKNTVIIDNKPLKAN